MVCSKHVCEHSPSDAGPAPRAGAGPRGRLLGFLELLSGGEETTKKGANELSTACDGAQGDLSKALSACGPGGVLASLGTQFSLYPAQMVNFSESPISLKNSRNLWIRPQTTYSLYPAGSTSPRCPQHPARGVARSGRSVNACQGMAEWCPISPSSENHGREASVT